ncbi:MAG TPA: SAM-dependent methyltransferase [Planctomycetes bacterium]|nr:SAM-dependent methyltransferase [Planctomycetota bacterium]
MRQHRAMLEQMASGFMPARVLLTALELDVFTACGAGAATAEELARRTGARPAPLARLLNALAALGLLDKRGDRYRATPPARTHLIAGRPGYLGDIMRHRASMWERWSDLTAIVRTGRVPPRAFTKERERRFIKGMANLGASAAPACARALRRELAGARRLLDIGGGPAVYACELARAWPKLSVVVLDLPGPLAYARETIAAYGLARRVSVKAGDVCAARSFGRGFDVAFMSSLIHSFKPAVVAEVIRKAAGALRPGGFLAVKEFFIDPGRASPPFTALFSINMLVAGAGDVYTRGEVEGWMRAAGVRPVRYVDLPQFSGIVVGRRL